MSSLLEPLVLDGTSKIVLLVLDGLGDLPNAEKGGQTPLEAARTPNFDAIVPAAALGRILPVAPGITPGSGPGHLALFGYDPVTTTVGRGVLEALGAGFALQPGDVAARANFCTLDAAHVVTDRRAAGDGAAEPTARIVNTFVSKAGEVLAGEHPANGVLMRGLSERPKFAGYRERFKLRAAAIAAYPMYRGVAELAGMEILKTGDAPGDAFATAASRWNDFDYFFIHVKGTDMAGEDGAFAAKVAAIESVDRALPEQMKLGPDVLCVTRDHSTPVPMKGHSWHPVPVLIHAKWCGADGAARFHEKTARAGSLGTMASRDLVAVLLANAGRLDKYGA